MNALQLKGEYYVGSRNKVRFVLLRRDPNLKVWESFIKKMVDCSSVIFRMDYSMAEEFIFFQTVPFLKEIFKKGKYKLKMESFSLMNSYTKVASKIVCFMAKLLRREKTTSLKEHSMEEPERTVS